MDPTESYIQKMRDQELNVPTVDGAYLESSEPDEDYNLVTSKISPQDFKFCTNFTKEEFLNLYTIFDLDIARLENNRGPKSKLSGEDKFFLLLTFLKSYDSYTSLARSFKISPSTLQRLVESMIRSLSNKFKETFILKTKREQQISLGIGFDEYPDVALILDCTVQPVPRMAGGFRDSKIYFSKKHGMYCVKKEFGHLPNGAVCFISSYYPGSGHDFAIFKENVAKYKNFLQKSDSESDYWKLMADKGYQGANVYLPSIIPKKGTNLTSAEIRENLRIGQARVICENYYGRMKTLWKASQQKIKDGLKNYDDIIDICASLTNFHISIHPLRSIENQEHRRLSRNIETNFISNDSSALNAQPSRANNNHQSNSSFDQGNDLLNN